MMAAYVGLDPKKDLTLVDDPAAKPVDLFAEGKLDACLAFPPEVQELCARKVGHVILRPPWTGPGRSCMLAANRGYAARYPVATKRVIRAVLKAADLCAGEPELAARLIVESGFTERYDFALEALREIPYDKWREYDPEDTLRFYALRLHELGTIKAVRSRSSPMAQTGAS
jgi:NitT/TauT family transport system substrate-binding protein